LRPISKAISASSFWASRGQDSTRCIVAPGDLQTQLVDPLAWTTAQCVPVFPVIGEMVHTATRRSALVMPGGKCHRDETQMPSDVSPSKSIIAII
jgi:hypothetical protein